MRYLTREIQNHEKVCKNEILSSQIEHFDRDFFALPLPFCGTAIKNTDSQTGIGVIFIRESLRDYCCLQAVRSCRYIRLYQ